MDHTVLKIGTNDLLAAGSFELLLVGRHKYKQRNHHMRLGQSNMLRCFLCREKWHRIDTLKHKIHNPNPVPVAQDAKAVVAFNLTMMDLYNAKVHPKVKEIVIDMQQKGLRGPVTNGTRTAVWLEQKHQFSRDQAEATARQLCSTYRNQWTS